MRHTNPKIIAITGGIATGKSTVSNFIKDRGYKVIDADKISKDLMKKGNINYKKTLEYFGQEILNENMEIDRKMLGKKVFSQANLLKVLNNITHRYIFKEIKNQIEKNNKENIIFLDIPLLFEEYDNILNHGIYFDEIWLVFADRDTQINRLIKRNNLTKDDAIKRVNAQIPIDKKKEKADTIIYNLESIENLKKFLEDLLEGLERDRRIM